MNESVLVSGGGEVVDPAWVKREGEVGAEGEVYDAVTASEVRGESGLGVGPV